MRGAGTQDGPIFTGADGQTTRTEVTRWTIPAPSPVPVQPDMAVTLDPGGVGGDP